MTDTKQQQHRKPWPKELLADINQVLDNFERGRDFKALESSVVKALHERECGISIRGYCVVPDNSRLSILEHSEFEFIQTEKEFAVYAKLAVDA